MEPFAIGTPVEKTNSLREHVIQNGARGVVREAIGPALPESPAPGTFGYFVQFEKHEAPMFVSGTRLREISAV